MKTYREYEPDQLFLLPPSMREWLPDGHLAYFVSDLVDQLDLSEIMREYEREERGYPPYHPLMMVKVLLYGYCVGVYSSRRIALKLEEDIAFRVLGAGNFPDFRTISDFRKRHLQALTGLFMQVVRVCRETGLVKLGHLSLDGTKVKANASKHKAMSYGRMKKEERRLREEIAGLLARAEQTDAAEDRRYGAEKRGDELPAELARRESRLKKIREAKAALEEETGREAAKRSGSKGSEKSGTGKSVSPKEKAQRNFTDPESRIMVSGEKAFIQGYNAQAAVDTGSQVIVGGMVCNQGVDKKHVIPLLEEVEVANGCLPQEVSADAGYYSSDNVEWLSKRGIEAYISPDKQKHNARPQPAPRGRIPKNLSVIERMRRKLCTERGRRRYGLRKQTVEPVFGQIKQARGFRQFLLRGLKKVQGEWSLVCTAHNVLKLHRALVAT